jgi:hypothetical protein
MNTPLKNCVSRQFVAESEPSSLIFGSTSSEDELSSIFFTIGNDSNLIRQDENGNVFVDSNGYPSRYTLIRQDAYVVLKDNGTLFPYCKAIRVKQILSDTLMELDATNIFGELVGTTNVSQLSYPKYRCINLYSDNAIMQNSPVSLTSNLEIKHNGFIAPFVLSVITAGIIYYTTFE